MGRKVLKKEKLNNEVNSLNDVTLEDSLLEGLGGGFTLRENRTSRHEANNDTYNVERYVDENNSEIVKKHMRKKKMLETCDPETETQKVREQDEVGKSKDDLMEADPGIGINMDQQKDGKMGSDSNFDLRLGKDRLKNHKVKKHKDKTASPSSLITVLKNNLSEEVNKDISEMDNRENGDTKKKKDRKQKKNEDLGDVQLIKSASHRKDEEHERVDLGDKIVDNVLSSRKESRKRKRPDNIDLEAASEAISKIPSNQRYTILEDRSDMESAENKTGDGTKRAEDEMKDEKKKKKQQKRDRNINNTVVESGGIDGKGVVNKGELLEGNILVKTAENGVGRDLARNKAGEERSREEDGNKDEKKKKKKRKKETDAGNNGVVSGGIAEQVGNERQLEENIIGRVELSRKGRNKKNRHNSNLEAASDKIMDEKLCNGSNIIGANKGNKHLTESKAGNIEIRDQTVTAECGNKVKKKKAKLLKNNLDVQSARGSEQKMDGEGVDPSVKSRPKGASKRVSFAEDVEIFPSSDVSSDEGDVQEGELVQGKRFSPEEDEMVKEAVLNYIDNKGLGEEGLKMVLQCKKYPEVKNCWKEIGAALPWRPYQSVYYRAHILFERDEKHSWTEEEYELVQKFHEKYGSDWKTLAEALGKHRIHVKDTWRRIKFTNRNKGRWSQDEYQSLFDLVNMDLRMKAFEERKTKHGMLRDNICWTAISDKMGTRATTTCCMKWYDQLTSPLVAEGKWLDVDDYRLLIVLYDVDACCMEDVDWDSLLEHRPGDICRKRWDQMVKHLGEHRNDSFADQVEVLIKRYCPDVLEAREIYNSKLAID